MAYFPRQRIPSLTSQQLWQTASLILASLAVIGCHSAHRTSTHTSDGVDSNLACRLNLDVPAESNLDIRRVDQDLATQLALQNNAAFQALRTQLMMASGDLIQASLLTNPNLTNIIPVGVKQWEWTLYAPLEAFILRPQRIVAADLEYHRVAQQLVQNGLQLARDARIAYVDAWLAEQQYLLAQEAQDLRKEIESITELQFKDGDISDVEATAARVDALNTMASRSIAEQTVMQSKIRLATIMGMPRQWPRLTLDGLPENRSPIAFDDSLIDRAVRSRPEMLAAVWSERAASQRATLARRQFWRIDGVIDANGKGNKGFEIGPGLRFDIPIFNRNQGGIVRADAELLQARRMRRAIHDQICQDVMLSIAQWQQAQEVVRLLEAETLPLLEEARTIAAKGYRDGGTPYLLILQTTTQYLDARTRHLDQLAARARAQADFERAMGCRWNGSVLPEPPTPESFDSNSRTPDKETAAAVDAK